MPCCCRWFTVRFHQLVAISWFYRTHGDDIHRNHLISHWDKSLFDRWYEIFTRHKLYYNNWKSNNKNYFAVDCCWFENNKSYESTIAIVLTKMTIGNLSCHPQPEVSDPKLAQTNTNILLTREAFGDEGWYNISFHQSNFNRIYNLY